MNPLLLSALIELSTIAKDEKKASLSTLHVISFVLHLMLSEVIIVELIRLEQIQHVVPWGGCAIQIVFKNLLDREPLMVELKYLHRYLDSTAVSVCLKEIQCQN